MVWDQRVAGSNPATPTIIAIGFWPADGRQPGKLRGTGMLARIYKPARTAMQSGNAATTKWLLEYQPEMRRPQIR